MTILSKIYLAAVIGFGVTGCSQVPVAYTITSGSHIRLSDEELVNKQKKPRSKFVVWGNHQGAINGAIEFFQRYGGSVIERARLQAVFDEQKIALTYGSEGDANLLKVGKLVGADTVVFVETTERTESFTPSRGTMHRIFMGLEAAGAAQQGRDPLYLKTPPPAPVTVYRPGITVRGVSVETSEILWSGSSILSQGVTDPEIAYPLLTQAAILRAWCPLEQGAEWIEYASDGSRQPWGCKDKQNR